MKVLVIVDLQNDFCPEGALAVTGGDEIVPTINALLRSGEYDLVVATKDYHPADHVSFADNHPGASVFDQVDTPKGPQVLWPRHCVQGTYGAQLHPLIDLNRVDHIVTKGCNSAVDSYSAFFDNARENETELRALLEEKACQRGETLHDVSVSICGLALDYCVAATARDAASLGLSTEVIVDACRAVDVSPKRSVELIRELVSHGVAPRVSTEILPQLSPALERALPRAVERTSERGV